MQLTSARWWHIHHLLLDRRWDFGYISAVQASPVTMHSALDIAAWFLNEVDRKAGDSITNLKLQKLVYYAQAWAVTLLGRKLFEEKVEAWAHGPVVMLFTRNTKATDTAAYPDRGRSPNSRPRSALCSRTFSPSTVSTPRSSWKS